MKYWTGLVLMLLLISPAVAEAQLFGKKEEDDKKSKKERRKIFQSTNGLLLGYEKGRNDYFQLGYGYNWKKIRLSKPVTRAVDGFVEYNFWENVLGMKVAYWQRHGRLKLTYGGHAGYFTDFDQGSLSIGPSVGFRLLGFHGQAGYNILLSNPEIAANKLYLSLSYLIPYHTRLFSRKGDKEKTIFRW
ncbi:hypothetical protein [Nafulsella turpanensis]|uniref:hypothetical protein n=1 Tax=Nafulsella turpanensis TaxID=1265690 RepID=UPI00037C36A0|nr:hypothetical protein [Nafulsella turpanensis]